MRRPWIAAVGLVVALAATGYAAAGYAMAASFAGADPAALDRWRTTAGPYLILGGAALAGAVWAAVSLWRGRRQKPRPM